MKKVKMPQMTGGNGIIHINPEENRELYYGLQSAVFLSLKNSGIINQVQYELCQKELYNQRYGL